MKISELFEAFKPVEEKDLGTIDIAPEGEGFIVRCTAKSGPMTQAMFWIWDAVGRKRGVKTFMLVSKLRGKAQRTEVEKDRGSVLISRRPSRLEFTGVSKEDLQAAVDKAIAKVHKSIKADAKYKADAPKRKAAASKYAAEKRKTDLAANTEKYGKGTWGRITYRQEGGDDGYSYVLRVDGRSRMAGLTQRQAMYYKEQEADRLAKEQGIGKYAKKA